MNKFNRLQILGMSVMSFPVLLVLVPFIIYSIPSQPKSKEVEVEVEVVEAPKPKVDTVIVVKETAVVKPEPVVKKEVVVVPPPPPVVEEVKVPVQKDSVIVEIVEEPDTTGQV